MTYRYRCPQCRTYVDPIAQGHYLVSYCCDEVVDKVWVCRECGENEAHTGCEECLSCLCDQFMAGELIACDSLKAEIADELARRSRVDTTTVPIIRMTERQAS